MIRIAAAALALTLAAPALTIPVTADAQVLAGRNAARAQAPRETREERLQNLLYEAEDRLSEIESSIAELEAEREGGAVLTPAQERQLTRLNQRRDREKREVERLSQQLEG